MLAAFLLGREGMAPSKIYVYDETLLLDVDRPYIHMHESFRDVGLEVPEMGGASLLVIQETTQEERAALNRFLGFALFYGLTVGIWDQYDKLYFASDHHEFAIFGPPDNDVDLPHSNNGT